MRGLLQMEKTKQKKKKQRKKRQTSTFLNAYNENINISPFLKY